MSASSISGMSSAPPAPSGAKHHVVHLYENDSSLVDRTSLLLQDSLSAGRSVVIVATVAHREAFASDLRSHGLDLAAASASGRYLSLDAEETLSKFLANREFDSQRFTELVGGLLAKAAQASLSSDPVVVFGEMVALLWSQGEHQAAIRLEELWNEIGTRHSFSLHCAYPMKSFDKPEHTGLFSRICAQHSSVIPEIESNATLVNEDAQSRTIAELQQRLHVLERERALYESEQRFRLLVEAVRDYAIFMLDPQGHISTWNIGAERIKGYHASEIIGKHFSCFYPPEDIQAEKPARELEIAIRDGRVEDEGWRIRKDGSKFWASVVITALRDATGTLIGFTKVTRDITERILAQQALQESQRKLQLSEKSLRDLSLHLLRTQDEERRQIGRDLHDSLGQYLSVLKMRLDALRTAAVRKNASNADELEQCSQLMNDAVKEVRTISYLLYPPMLEEMGLKTAIPWYLDGFAQRSGVKTKFEISSTFGRLDRDIELAMFRVLQESLTNVHRHSGSSEASIRLGTENSEFFLEISDKGKGIPIQKFEEAGRDWMGSRGVGLRGMTERMHQIGGRLDISSTDQGTVVRAVVPRPSAPVSNASQALN
jgi:PAS domain S-box-containing protein